MSYFARNFTTADGIGPTVAIPFPYINQPDVHVYDNGAPYAGAISFVSGSTINLTPFPVAGHTIEVRRQTLNSAMLAQIQTGTINPADLNLDYTQLLYLQQEQNDQEQVDIGIAQGAAAQAVGAAALLGSANFSARTIDVAEAKNITLNAPPASLGGIGTFGGMRVLLFGQTNTTQNGLYTLTGGVLVRTADANTSGAFIGGMRLYASKGNYLGRVFSLDDVGAAFVLGTNGLTFRADMTLRGRAPFAPNGNVYVRGDSFSAEPNAHTSSGDSWAKKFTNLLGFTFLGNPTSGNTAADQEDLIYGNAGPGTVNAGDIQVHALGTNDTQFVSNSNQVLKRETSAYTILANLLNMGTPDGAMKLSAQSATKNGGNAWGNIGASIDTMGVFSSQNGDTLQWITPSCRYLAVLFFQNIGESGTFEVFVDGTPYLDTGAQPWTTQPRAGMVLSNVGRVYQMSAILIDTGRLSTGKTVQVQITSATNAGNQVLISRLICWDGTPLSGPLLLAANLSDRGAAGYATAANSQINTPIHSRLIESCIAKCEMVGIRVKLLDWAATLNPNTDLDVDQFHPAEGGAVKLANQAFTAFEESLIEFSQDEPVDYVRGAMAAPVGVSQMQGSVPVWDLWQWVVRPLTSADMDWSGGAFLQRTVAAGAGPAGVITLATPQDIAGDGPVLVYQAQNGALNGVIYGYTGVLIDNNTPSTESGHWTWFLKEAGNLNEIMRYNPRVGLKLLKGLGLFGNTPPAQPSRTGQLTDSTGGTISSTLAAITAGAAYAQADMVAVKNALASIAAKLNAMETNDHNMGITA